MPRACTTRSPQTTSSLASVGQPAAFSATEVRYGPRKTEMTVVEKAEFAQSYMYQPTRSRRVLDWAAGPAGATGTSVDMIGMMPSRSGLRHSPFGQRAE